MDAAKKLILLTENIACRYNRIFCIRDKGSKISKIVTFCYIVGYFACI